MTHPYTDPFHSGLFQLTPSQQLMSRDLLRRRGGGGMLSGPSDSAGGPLSGIGDAVSSVLGAAGHGRYHDRQPVQSDAEPPSQAVHSDGENLVHTRDNRDGTTTSTHLGPDDLSSPDSGRVVGSGA